ncbi:double-stranded RNA binding domain-containing protein-containing protein [Coprinopsis cinerea okayama7|uniref:Double-stranded RNA binding domain-containing protein-containing protein n=1 Tax=Coprinopsis cinerea (strain Okayama-7 / 130 / ATCC MYA-4618 / FGSC 9003) TaxID=240176 RepID=A8NZ66_COPC7|nr:double-stranded RNA binding domain-containing protein-containing protein [Coprinopsis cinerea okayama7\|eukprot:XP_001837616.2 double-stranded RNA binding domain-containing protein-containing protein [Coprinopsis cinerea okayama7\
MNKFGNNLSSLPGFTRCTLVLGQPRTSGTENLIQFGSRAWSSSRPLNSDHSTTQPVEEEGEDKPTPDLPAELIAMRLNPDFGPNNVNFPPLPEITNRNIELQVFTHRSYHARPTHVFEDHINDLSPDNERYEHLGDTVLGLVVTNLMFDMFPGLRVGPSTKIRSLVVGNSTLAEISKKYRLPDRLRLHQAQAITLRASTNVQADVFEAFVGGLFKDQDLPAVQRWLNPLFRPYAKAAYDYVRKQTNLPPLPPSSHYLSRNGASNNGSSHPEVTMSSANDSQGDYAVGPTIGHLALFNQHLQRSSRVVEWIYSDGSDPSEGMDTDGGSTACPALNAIENIDGSNKENYANGNSGSHHTPNGTANGKPNGVNGAKGKWYSDPCVPDHLRIKSSPLNPVWYVKVLVDGEFYGRGRGNTKKAARNEAAKEGLVKLGIEV